MMVEGLRPSLSTSKPRRNEARRQSELRARYPAEENFYSDISRFAVTMGVERDN